MARRPIPIPRLPRAGSTGHRTPEKIPPIFQRTHPVIQLSRTTAFAGTYPCLQLPIEFIQPSVLVKVHAAQDANDSQTLIHHFCESLNSRWRWMESRF